MGDLTIHDDSVIDRLRTIAAQEERSIEEILSDLLDRYPGQPSPSALSAGDRVQRLRRLGYERARRIWREHGAEARARLTDEEMDDQFLMFDADDYPRLKSEEGTFKPSPLAELAAIAKQAHLDLGDEDVSSRADEILRDEFADYLIKRQNRDQDATTEPD